MKRTVLGCLALLLLATPLPADDWMKRLPDDAFAAVLSIPGAHDAATGSGFDGALASLGARYAQTQELSLAELWSAGVRAFDLRPCLCDGYMNINHGIMPTTVRFDAALRLLCDSLRRSPSEFAVVHLLHATDGDQVADDYGERLRQLLAEEEWQPFLVDFRADLTVGDLRGKLLIISRDRYADSPVTGGIFTGWTGAIDWQQQNAGRIIGPGGASARLSVQDYSDTHGEGGVARKVEALKRMLTFTAARVATTAAAIRWAFNFASAYSLVESLFGVDISLSDGYRDNATYTHAAIIDFLDNHAAGPTGIVMLDFAGVDHSGGYHVRGQEVVRRLIDNNFRYLSDVSAVGHLPALAPAAPAFDLQGRPRSTSAPRGVTLVGGRKVLR